jgi:adenosylhomocysteine nucleosidase
MIGITFALPSESSDLRRQVSSAERSGELLLGNIGHNEVAIIHTGVGEKHCNSRLELLLHRARPRFVISSGFAGAVHEQLHSGDLIIAQNFSNAELLARAEEILRSSAPQTVKLFTTSAIVDSLTERNEIARASGAAAVDMESGAIASVCHAHGTPLLSMRVITDTPQEPFPAPPAVLFDMERQRPNYLRLGSYLIVHPGSIGGLARFCKRIARARQILAEAIMQLLSAL